LQRNVGLGMPVRDVERCCGAQNFRCASWFNDLAECSLPLSCLLTRFLGLFLKSITHAILGLF